MSDLKETPQTSETLAEFSAPFAQPWNEKCFFCSKCSGCLELFEMVATVMNGPQDARRMSRQVGNSLGGISDRIGHRFVPS